MSSEGFFFFFFLKEKNVSLSEIKPAGDLSKDLGSNKTLVLRLIAVNKRFPSLLPVLLYSSHMSSARIDAFAKVTLKWKNSLAEHIYWMYQAFNL